MNNPIETPSIINNLNFSYFLSFAMITGIKLDIFTELSKSSKNVDELATNLNLNAGKLLLLLYMLVNAQLMKVDNGIFTNTDETNKFLVRDNPGYIGGFISMMLGSIQKTEETIRTGKPQSKLDFETLPEDILFKIFQGLHTGALKIGIELAARLNLFQYKHLLDVAGGSGGLAIGIYQSCSDIKATIVELPTIASITRKFISESNMSNRINIIECDLVKKAPEGIYDIAIMHHFIQVLSPNMAREAIKNIYDALEPGGTLYIIGKILNDSHLSPAQSVAFNLVFINTYDEGQAFTEKEYIEWIKEAKFVDININNNIPPNGEAIITARKL